MADRITIIEDNIIRALQKINPINATPWYTPYSTTGQVQLYDLQLSLDTNVSDNTIDYHNANLLINHKIDIDVNGEVNDDYEYGQNQYSNKIHYKITSFITIDGDEANPIRSAQVRGNQVLSDLKWVFGNHYDLWKSCQFIQYVGWDRSYDQMNDLTQPIQLHTYWIVFYNQEMLNPNSKECV